MDILKIYSIVTTLFVTVLLGLFLYANHQVTSMMDQAKDREITIQELRHEVESTRDTLKLYKGMFGGLESQIDHVARAMYSETDRVTEAWYVGWALRNRVETNYRGNCSYKDAVLDPYQFSAFNRGRPSRERLLAMDKDTPNARFQSMRHLARIIIYSDRSVAPFDRGVRHFYSEVSMTNNSAPYWADEGKRVHVEGVDEKRFRFYSEVM